MHTEACSKIYPFTYKHTSSAEKQRHILECYVPPVNVLRGVTACILWKPICACVSKLVGSPSWCGVHMHTKSKRRLFHEKHSTTTQTTEPL